MRLVLDFADHPGQVIRRVFTQPSVVLKAYHPDEVRPLLVQIEAATRAGAYAAGYMSYECAPAFEPSARVHAIPSQQPIAQFGVFTAPQSMLLAAPTAEPPSCSPWKLDVSPEVYAQNIRLIHEAIERGDTYQINYTLRASARLTGSSWQFYERLRRAQRADYCAWLDCDDFQILSTSPELFFAKTGNVVTTRPMKGTVRRGGQPEEDAALERWLSESRKNRAENLMIVDLLRNDLSRIARLGSVHVPALFTIERYPTVLQMTSTVQATLRDEITLGDVFAALFPCGSITGAPKLKSMELIQQLETTPRGPYCGAIGWIKPGGDAQFNVAIRTLTLNTNSGAMVCGLGGGITWDSRSDEEYAEVVTKSKFLEFESEGYELLETLLLRDGQFWLEHHHLARLTQSAATLGFPAPSAVLRQTLARYALQYSQGDYRVRLCYGQEGTVHLEGFPLQPNPALTVSVALARSPVSSRDALLQHKTTQRALYEHHIHAAPPGHYDVLLWNERGEVTEFTRGNLVLEQNETFYTPPQDCGLLPGTYRQCLLDEGQIMERVITLADLADAEALWFVNSVRGWVAVQLPPGAIEQAILDFQS